MATNPINLAIRFLVLEVGGLFAFGLWGAYIGNGVLGFILAAVLVISVSVIWAVFGTLGDEHRAPPKVPVNGKVRLLIEFSVFVLATLAFFAVGATTLGLIYGVVAVLQNLASYNRIGWLWQH